MVNGPSTDGYTPRHVAFDDWADVDTLIHRTALTSGDFDYALRPLCPDCGNFLEPTYDELEGGATVLRELVCDDCRVVWRMNPDEVS